MKTAQLLSRSLLHYWRTNLAVLLGVVAATAVIGGALVVGDSVRESLKQMSLDRLGNISHALSGGRFIREDLVDQLAATPPDGIELTGVAPAIAMTGSVEHEQQETGDVSARISRAGSVNVYAVDERFWKLTDAASTAPEGNQVVVNRQLANQLGLQVDDGISVVIEIPATIPRDSLLGDRDQTVTELLLTVTAIAEDAATLGRFGLNPTQQLPRNVYVSLETLQQQVGLNAVRRTRRNPVAKPARVNALFTGVAAEASAKGPDAPATAEALTNQLHADLSLADLSLRLVRSEDRGYVSLEAEQMILERSVADAAGKVAAGMQASTSPVLVYLLNEIWNRQSPENFSMYSIVAGIDFDAEPPFGPFEFVAGGPPADDSPQQIVVNEWLAEDLNVSVGDAIGVKYKVVGDRGELPDEEMTFEVSGILRLEGPAADPGMTPYVAGITDADTFSDWRQPFPMDLGRVTDRDEDYWDAHRTTPKLFLPFAVARDLWESRYGELTSLRLAPADGGDLNAFADTFETRLLEALSPEETGLIVGPVMYQGVQAAAGTTDFTGLFIGFSFFLILSATILVGLLFRLGIERRVQQIGLLTAVGVAPRQVRRLFLMEGAIVVGVGGLIGCLAAIGYAWLMIYGLKTWWIGAIGTRFLFLSVCPLSLAIGFAIAVFVALLAIWWAMRQLRGISTRELLAGVSDVAESTAGKGLQSRVAGRTATIAAAVATLLLIGSLTGLVPDDQEAFSGFSWQTVAFFVTGIAALIASLAGLSAALKSDRAAALRGAGIAALARLGLRNSARHRQRSVLTASLIASATFVIVAVAAGQRNPAMEAPVKESGNGGFTLVAETGTPILYDLNTVEGRIRAGMGDSLSEADVSLLNAAQIVPFRVRQGENASCLNLYQTTLPTILGVPPDVIDLMASESRFAFANTPSNAPWNLLNEDRGEHVVPVLGDMNTLQYSLHKGIGQTLPVPDTEVELQIAGMFDGSVFQGVLLMSEERFLKLFPDEAGFEYFLIEVEPDRATELANLLESRLGDYGFDVERVADRLASFLAVQNTYLSTFQTLGGLGLLLGTLGLATVMLRNVLERRGELALLRAVGYRNRHVALLVLWENAFLMLWGLASGSVSALLAMLPRLVSIGADVPWQNLQLLLLAVFVVGMLAALAAVKEATRLPILATLRSE
ncbi:MAG: FtsX-like permease family protein [Maioricimonas sp. JB049]